MALAVDVTATGDTPNGYRMSVNLGGGAAIKAKDAGLLVDPRLRDLLVKRATEARIPHQMEVLEGGRTDATEMQLARGGAIAGCVSIPCRYLHSPSEVGRPRRRQSRRQPAGRDAVETDRTLGITNY